MAKKRVHLIISGRVQGVGFRCNTFRQAVELGIHGWVRNIPDNKVEAVFEGDDHIVEQMVQWCYKGPSMSHVYNIEITKQQYSGEFQNFSIRR